MTSIAQTLVEMRNEQTGTHKAILHRHLRTLQKRIQKQSELEIIFVDKKIINVIKQLQDTARYLLSIRKSLK